MNTTYDISGILPDETISEISGGTNVLISGPAMIGKQELAIKLIASGHDRDEGILIVTTRRNATSLINDFKQIIPDLDTDRIGIVNCSGTDDRQRLDEIALEKVSSPGDLTGISIGTARLLQGFYDRDISEVRHGLISLSTMIQYLNIETVFKFIHIYTSRIEDTNGIGVFTIDNDSHEPRTVNVISSEYDLIIELRENESGDLELRVLGPESGSRSWYPY